MSSVAVDVARPITDALEISLDDVLRVIKECEDLTEWERIHIIQCMTTLMLWSRHCLKCQSTLEEAHCSYPGCDAMLFDMDHIKACPAFASGAGTCSNLQCSKIRNVTNHMYICSKTDDLCELCTNLRIHDLDKEIPDGDYKEPVVYKSKNDIPRSPNSVTNEDMKIFSNEKFNNNNQ